MLGGAQPLEAGDRLGDFVIEKVLGEGGMGIVYLARDERLDRQVALKVIVPQLAHDPEFRERFEFEARSAAAIDHPNVIPIYSAGASEDRLFIAMRYLEGTDLRTLLREQGPLEPEEAVAIVADVAAALDAAHSAGLVHRDVKPANVLIAGSAGNRSAYLTDFGLTKGLQGNSAQLTGTGQWIGTVDYVAPEQMTTGLVDARTDVYALGCVLFEMLTGSPPFAGSDMQKMWHQVNEPVPALGEELDALDPVIARATEKEPGERFPSAGDFARAARAAVEGTVADVPEQSVATGAAASGLATAGVPERTRTMRRLAPAAEERLTTPMSVPPAPARRRADGGGLSGRTAAIVGASVVFAAGLIAAALVLSGNNGGSAGRTVVNNVKTVTGESPTSEKEATAGADTEAAASGASIPTEGAGSGESEPFTRFSQNLYSVEVPTGWIQEASDEPISTYYESVWRDPDEENSSITVDAQVPAPEVPAIVSAEEVRSETSQSSGYRELGFDETFIAGVPAARWVFEVSGDRRVDYFLNACNVGLAVLGSTYPSSFDSLAPTFHHAAASVAVYCE
jgi:predicted Ser/Thr protein kinase